jgi:hypothetical protein
MLNIHQVRTHLRALAMTSLALHAAPGGSAAFASAPCEPSWLPTFVGEGALSNDVEVLAIFDDGTGPALYAGGDFVMAGSQTVNRVAKWDGDSWEPLGEGLNNTVRAFAVFDGSLYAGGDFTGSGAVAGLNQIARWNGTSWEAVGSGVSGGLVRALEVFDDGSGEALYVGGGFTSAGGVPDTRSIARWSGTSWSPLSSGTNQRVNALKVFDDGTGPALYAGGRFSNAGGVPANRVAKWNGILWSALDEGVTGGSSPWVRALEVYDDGDGPALYVGGGFNSANSVPGTSCIAKWDGNSWSALASGLGRNSTASVDAIAVFDDGSGPALFAGGFLGFAGALEINNIARWNGVSWSPLDEGTNNYVLALAAIPPSETTGGHLFVGGNFSNAGGASAGRMGLWAGCPTRPAAVCRGDANGDNAVNFADLNAVLSDFGLTGDNLVGDVNNDDCVNFSDLNEVLSSFGITCD